MSEPFVAAIDQTITMLGLSQTIQLNGTELTEITNISIPDVTTPIPSGYMKEAVAEFANRYVSLDTIQGNEDGSDLAYMRVLQFNNGKFGKQVYPITNSKETKYKEFIITGISQAFVEKAQILKTNSTLQVYAFDSQPEVLSIQGVLKSTTTDKWDIAMILIWDELIRLTKLVQQRLIVEFGYESKVYWGYPLNFQYQKSSSAMFLASFSMQFLIVKRTMMLREDNIFITDLIDQLNQVTD